MKKIYLRPIVDFSEIEAEEIMAASGESEDNDLHFIYGDNGEGSSGPTGNTGPLVTGAKESMGDFAFTEDFEYSIDM